MIILKCYMLQKYRSFLTALYSNLQPCTWAMAQSVGKLLFERMIPTWGVPSELHSDRGTRFTGHIVKEMCKSWLITQHFHWTHHPQSSGLVERTHGAIKLKLRWLKLWTLIPSLGLKLFHGSPQPQIFSDKHHLSPFETVTGRPMRLKERLWSYIT